MAPIRDLLHHAEAAEQLAAWMGGDDRVRLLEIATDLRRRASGRARLWFWISTTTAPRRLSDVCIDESWQDPEWVRFTLTTTTGPASFEAPRAMVPRLVSQMARLNHGEPPNHVMLEPGGWRFLSSRNGEMALQVELREGGAICLPLARSQAAKLLSWLELALGGLRLRRLRFDARDPAAAATSKRPIRFHRVQGES